MESAVLVFPGEMEDGHRMSLLVTASNSARRGRNGPAGNDGRIKTLLHQERRRRDRGETEERRRRDGGETDASAMILMRKINLWVWDLKVRRAKRETIQMRKMTEEFSSKGNTGIISGCAKELKLVRKSNILFLVDRLETLKSEAANVISKSW